KTIYDGCVMARGHGATVKRFRHNDLEGLESKLRESSVTPRLIALDGVNSMTGNAPDIPAFARLAREYNALLYGDDAHGFGVVGERGSDEPSDYGLRGNSIVRHCGETYENVVLVGGFSKAYSSLLAFMACPTQLKELLKTAAPPYAYSGPSPVASLATALEGLSANERTGDLRRKEVHRLTHKVLERLAELGIATPNESGYPIIGISLVNADDIDEVGDYLFDRGIYVTMAAYPLVPKDEVGFRVQLTAANTDAEVDQLNAVLGELAERFQVQTRE
ncbi:MAG: aminotransferase class I/II-fold pyridoxal phosphate-dependent enzyme, partial [Pseudonocardiaceae bacterium]